MKKISNLAHKMIRDYLFLHEADIAQSINDFDCLETPFIEIIGKHPVDPFKMGKEAKAISDG